MNHNPNTASEAKRERHVFARGYDGALLCDGMAVVSPDNIFPRSATAQIVHDHESLPAVVQALEKILEHAAMAHWDKQDSVFGITCDQARSALASFKKGQA